MAHRLTVELNDSEMSKIEEAARDLRLDPQRLTAKQLVLALGAADGAGPVPGDTGGHRADASTDARRAKRLAAVMAVHGIWKDDPTKPQDGAAYQREVRAEWR